MDNLNINLGIKRITINGDPNRVIEFNPSDVAFAERFYALMGDLNAKQAEYQKRAKQLESNSVTTDGLPVNFAANLALMREVCTFMRSKIDDLFGPGTSQTVFEDNNTLNMFEQFFTGITPFIQAARAEKTARYQRPKHSGKKVME